MRGCYFGSVVMQVMYFQWLHHKSAVANKSPCRHGWCLHIPILIQDQRPLSPIQDSLSSVALLLQQTLHKAAYNTRQGKREWVTTTQSPTCVCVSVCESMYILYCIYCLFIVIFTLLFMFGKRVRLHVALLQKVWNEYTKLKVSLDVKLASALLQKQIKTRRMKTLML